MFHQKSFSEKVVCTPKWQVDIIIYLYFLFMYHQVKKLKLPVDSIVSYDFNQKLTNV